MNEEFFAISNVSLLPCRKQRYIRIIKKEGAYVCDLPEEAKAPLAKQKRGAYFHGPKGNPRKRGVERSAGQDSIRKQKDAKCKL